MSSKTDSTPIMNILDKIIAHKRMEVEQNRVNTPVPELEKRPNFGRNTISLSRSLRESETGNIAEFKRKSPSKGVINAHAPVERTTIGYMQAGASALSVLTDKQFFGGSNDDLTIARKFNFCPILRKDFIVDEYQIIEAKSIGADAILLIAAALTPSECSRFGTLAHTLGMEVLLEVHDADELRSHVHIGCDLLGVNNRSLKTFDVNLEISASLTTLIPAGIVKVSESGISTPETILALRELGYQGFLMGENFMKYSRPEQAAKDFVKSLRREQAVKRGQQV